MLGNYIYASVAIQRVFYILCVPVRVAVFGTRRISTLVGNLNHLVLRGPHLFYLISGSVAHGKWFYRIWEKLGNNLIHFKMQLGRSEENSS